MCCYLNYNIIKLIIAKNCNGFKKDLLKKKLWNIDLLLIKKKKPFPNCIYTASVIAAIFLTKFEENYI